MVEWNALVSFILQSGGRRGARPESLTDRRTHPCSCLSFGTPWLPREQPAMPRPTPPTGCRPRRTNSSLPGRRPGRPVKQGVTQRVLSLHTAATAQRLAACADSVMAATQQKDKQAHPQNKNKKSREGADVASSVASLPPPSTPPPNSPAPVCRHSANVPLAHGTYGFLPQPHVNAADVVLVHTRQDADAVADGKVRHAHGTHAPPPPLP